MALDSLGAENYAQGQAQAFEDWSLLYMQLQVGRGVSPLHGRIPDAVDVDVALAQSIFEANTIAVRSAAIGLDGVGPGKCRGTEKAAAKASPLLVGPVHQANGDRRFAVVSPLPDCATPRNWRGPPGSHRANRHWELSRDDSRG